MRWLRRSPWPGVLAVLLGLALTEAHRACDTRRMAKTEQDALMRRMDLRFDWLKAADMIKTIWMESASPKLGINPPMRLDSEWPQDVPICRPLDPPGLYAAEPEASYAP